MNFWIVEVEKDRIWGVVFLTGRREGGGGREGRRGFDKGFGKVQRAAENQGKTAFTRNRRLDRNGGEEGKRKNGSLHTKKHEKGRKFWNPGGADKLET